MYLTASRFSCGYGTFNAPRGLRFQTPPPNFITAERGLWLSRHVSITIIFYMHHGAWFEAMGSLVGGGVYKRGLNKAVRLSFGGKILGNCDVEIIVGPFGP